VSGAGTMGTDQVRSWKGGRGQSLVLPVLGVSSSRGQGAVPGAISPAS